MTLSSPVRSVSETDEPLTVADALVDSLVGWNVEAIFGVSVTGVNTINVKGKTKRWKGKPYKRNDLKKAVVTLKDGDSIDVTSGI